MRISLRYQTEQSVLLVGLCIKKVPIVPTVLVCKKFIFTVGVLIYRGSGSKVFFFFSYFILALNTLEEQWYRSHLLKEQILIQNIKSIPLLVKITIASFL